ncbi:MAG: TRL-like family protein [Leptospirales bacterium]|nr:TRL-like family protein [Leptospirales bacterium]
MVRQSYWFAPLAAVLIWMLGGCYGLVYRKHTDPARVGNAANLSVQRSCFRSYLGLVSTGDASLRPAIKNGNLIAMHSTEREYTLVLGFLYRRYCVILTGTPGQSAE